MQQGPACSPVLVVNPPLLWSVEPLQGWNRVAASCRYLQGFFLCVHPTQLLVSSMSLPRQKQIRKVLSVCHPALLRQFMLENEIVLTREIGFLRISQEVKTGALEETVAVRLHAFSIRTGSHRVHVQIR